MEQSWENRVATQEKAKSPEGAKLSRKFNTATIEGKYSQELWDDFWYYYDSVMADREKNRLIHYPAKEFWLEGIPSPRQIIAWRNFIKMIGEPNFNNKDLIPLDLNNLGNPEPLFQTKFNDIYGDSKNLEIIFVCGYFWKLYPKRRQTMIDFVVRKMLKKDSTVTIWTQDRTLNGDFQERIKADREITEEQRRNLHIHRCRRRFDLHYTLVKCKDKNNNLDLEKSHAFMELIHTEAYEYRLETYFPLNQFTDVDDYGSSAEKFLGLLKRQLLFDPLKIIRSKFNMALNVDSQ